MEKYTKEYFIKKFEAIPEDQIGISRLESYCALHHVGVGVVDGRQTGKYYDENDKPIITDETCAFILLFGGRDCKDFSAVYEVNDSNIYGKTPKQRILNYLNGHLILN